MHYRRTAVFALLTLLPLSACGSSPGAGSEQPPDGPGEPLEEEGVVGESVSVDFAGGKYQFVQPRGANGEELGMMIRSQVGPGQVNAVDAPLSEGATALELFLGLSSDGAQAPSWLVEDHAAALVRRGRPADELRELSIEPPAVQKAFSTSRCSQLLLGPNRYTPDVAYYEDNNRSKYLDYSLTLGGRYGVSGRGMMGICNDSDVQALIWFRVEYDGEVVAGETWNRVPVGWTQSLYYEANGFLDMRMRAQGNDYHARARWVVPHFEGYDGPF